MIGNQLCHAKKCVKIISTVSEPINLLLDIPLDDFCESYQMRNQSIHREGAFYALSETAPFGYFNIRTCRNDEKSAFKLYFNTQAKIMSQPEADLPFILFIASRKKSFG